MYRFGRVCITHEGKMAVDANNYNVKSKKLSDEHRSNLRAYRTGKKHSEETKDKISINNGRYNLGKHLSEETRQKISYSKCKNKSELDGFVTPINKRIRASKEWKNWRLATFERDGYTCQKKECKFCNNKKGVTLHPHHIKPFATHIEERFNIDNGITYCADYHIKSRELHKNIGGEEHFNKR